MEFSEVLVKENPGLCRCCLSEGCYKDLSTNYTWMNDTEVYADMLLECFDISITQQNHGPNGPNRLICEVCITRLRDACNFKKQVLESEKKFVNMVEEMRPKIILFPPNAMKAEIQIEETNPDDDVEYLDEFDFDDEALKNQEVAKESEVLPEPSGSEDITVSTLPVKNKRGRPRKHSVKTEKSSKVKLEDKPRTSKAAAKDETANNDRLLEKRRKDNLAELLTIIIENSTIIPFRWMCNKYMCFYCCCPFLESSKLQEHMRVEHEKVKLKNVLRSILGNTRIKLDVSNINCKLCYQRCLNLTDFLKHVTEIHSIIYQTDVLNCLYVFNLSDNTMYCIDCGQEFSFFGTMLRHVHKFHNKSYKFICEWCGESFVGKANVNAHVKAVHTDQCAECNEKFGTKAALKLHESTVHNTKVKCTKCSQVFNSRYYKNRHMNDVHGVETAKIKCDYCDKEFKFKSKMVEHKKRIHFKERKLACEICGFKGFNKNAVRRHMVKHSDDRPFECDVCKKTFQRKKTLQFHVRIHTNDRRYACKECGKAFVQATSLKVHMRVHHAYHNN